MGASRWDSWAHDPTDASRDLAEHLRFLLDREGLTPRQLAAEHDVPYSPTMLYQFLSGQALPTPQLIEVIARRCGGDLEGLQLAYDRARRGAMGSVKRPKGPKHAKHARNPSKPIWPRLADRSRLITAGVGFSAIGALVFATTAVSGFGGNPSASEAPADRPAPQTNPGDVQGPPSAPNPETLIPEPSQRSVSAKQKPKAVDKDKKTAKPPEDDRDDEVGSAATLVQNGTFTGSVSPWQATPGVRVRPQDNQMRVVVQPRDNDNGNAAALVSSNLFALQPGRTYVLRFDASANDPAAIAALVQYQSPTPGNALAQPARLNSSSQSFAFAFTTPTEAAATAVVRFQFASGDERYQVSMDNVSVSLSG